MKTTPCLYALAACAMLLRGQTPAETPLNERVMVVYNAAGEGSQKVAKYYMEKRNIPKANLCKINTEILEGFSDEKRFESEVRKPVRACLEKIGKQQILYIVLTYQTPFDTTYGGQLNVAIDQVIADIWDEYAKPGVTGFMTGEQPYFGQAESQGNVYQPYIPFAKYRDQPNAKTIYSVWRLDGPTVAVAESLVDKAMAAEANGLHGKAYFDIRVSLEAMHLTADSGYGAGDWDVFQSSQIVKKAGFDVTLDTNETEFGTAPSLLRCENAALYAGWYSLNHYNDAFSWAPGAIGFHLDSASAINPRTGANWAAGALQRGITVTSGAVAEPYLEGLVHPDQIFLYLFQGANVGDAVVRGTRWLKWMIINLGDPLYRPFPKGLEPYGPTPHQESWFGIAPTITVGSATIRAQFVLAQKRDAAVPVELTSNSPALVTLPTNMILPSNAAGAQFPITVKAPPEPIGIVLTLHAGQETLSNTLNVFPVLSNLTLSQPNVKGESSVVGTVSAMVSAKESGFTIKLSSNQPAVAVPEQITIPAGEKSATFSIAGKRVAAELTAVITASYEGASKTAQLKVTP